MVEDVGVPKPDTAVWGALHDRVFSSHLLRQPDFYYREGHVVVVGQAPTRAG